MKPKELKAARLKSGLSQDKAARFNNVPTSTWQSWELGRRKIPVDFVLVLPAKKSFDLCEDCPPLYWATDKTRCKSCPRTAVIRRVSK